MRGASLVVVLLASTVSLAGCLVDPASDGTPPPAPVAPEPEITWPAGPFSFAMRGCHETLLVFPVGLDSAEGALPEGYTPLLAVTGAARLVVSTFLCDPPEDENSTDAPLVHAFGILVESPDGAVGAHAYAVQLGRCSELHDAMFTANGFASDVACLVAADYTEDELVTEFAANILGQGWGYLHRFALLAPTPDVPVPLPTDTVWWQEGNGTTARMTFTRTEHRLAPARAVIDFGGGEISGNGAWQHTDVTVDVALV